jgi:hypothetical protein
MLKKRMLSLIILVLGLAWSFVLCGCNKDDGDAVTDPDLPGTGGNAGTSVPTELRGKWYDLERFDHEYDELEMADITFTGNRFYVGDPDVYGVEMLVRVTGKKIEFAYLMDTGFMIPLLLCDSYNISNGVLTFTGGGYDGESYKQK